MNITGIILAGGLSRRMGGGDKFLLESGDRTLLDRVIERLTPQADPVLLNANGGAERLSRFGLPVVPDVIAGHGGPLIGILTGLEWCRTHAPQVRRLLSVAADTPLFPLDLAARLAQAAEAEGAEIAVARSGGQAHHVFALWSINLVDDLRRAVTQGGLRSVHRLQAERRTVFVDWPVEPVDPFFNVNTPDDAARLAEMGA